MPRGKGAAKAAGKPPSKGVQATKDAAKAASKKTAGSGGQKGTTGKRSQSSKFTIGDTPTGKAAIEAISKNTGKKGSFWSNKAIKDTAAAAEKGKTQRTAFRSAAAASVATSYANNMDGGLQFASTSNPTLDNSGNTEPEVDGRDGKKVQRTVYEAGQK